jgi:D-alanyl-D-alanine carboxypeptidase/D-alanyl-D-alanine-endopeptidase (penicillin-binding protein 4)
VVAILLATISACSYDRLSARADEPPVRNSPLQLLDLRVRSVLETPGYQHGHWGLLVVDAVHGQTVYERNADQLFAPASVTKLFSAAAALVELGPDHRFETPLVRRGEVDTKGILHGDLILIAQGDPSMGGRTASDGSLLFRDDDHTYAGGNLRSEVVGADPLAGLDHLAREVHAAGIKQVTGDVIVDDRLFDHAESSGSGPRRLSPIMINDNVLDIIVEPGHDVNKPASVKFAPQTQALAMDAQVETVSSDQRPRLEVRGIGPYRFRVRGKIPLGHRRVVVIHEVDEPASFARSLLIEALRRREVRVEASPLGQNTMHDLAARSRVARLPRVAVYTSPPFREFIKVILKVSHNLHASTLPMLVAARRGDRTLESGLKRQGEVLRSLGIDPATISFGGGAGGSRADLVTPRATVALLRAMSARPDAAAYNAALPILGRDGTLARAVAADSPARGHAHAKTGTYWVDNELSGKALLTSKALAGYLETRSGRPLVVAFFLNNVMLDAPRPGRTVSDATAEAGRLLGKLCEVFYAWDGDDQPDLNSKTNPASRNGQPGTSPPR